MAKRFPNTKTYSGKEYFISGIASTKAKATPKVKALRKSNYVRTYNSKTVRTGHQYAIATGQKKGRTAVYRRPKTTKRKTTKSRRRKG